MNTPIILHTHGLTVGYHEKNAAKTTIASGIDLEFHQGTLTCLIGPNGAGKSTLLRTLIGLQRPLAGEIWLHDLPLKSIPTRELSKLISIVLTEPPETDHMTVFDLVSLGRHPYTNWLGKLESYDKEAIFNALDLTHANALASRQVHTLSDGERQKVMIARAIAQEPILMVLDEPTAFLDFPHRIDILHMLKTLVLRKNCAVLLSTHDLELALNTADTILLMDQDGSLSHGAPEDHILSGRYQQAFNPSGKFEFDPLNASFHIPGHQGNHVSIVGDDLLARHWTQHAFERIGWIVDESPSAPHCVYVKNEGNEYTWELSGCERNKQNFSSIAQLIAFCKNI
ncbi:MAG: ABC transporter ATP-binding protein [Anaerolineae bacterium]|nr:ABC transporter ATP-binding protein [Anaerolineae bacterium]